MNLSTMNKSLLIFLGVSIFIAGCASTNQNSKIIGTNQTCIDKNKSISLEVAKLNDWPVEKVAAATYLKDGEEVTSYMNAIKIPEKFICH